VVDPERLELPTPAFEAQCSIQLSYGSDFLRTTWIVYIVAPKTPALFLQRMEGRGQDARARDSLTGDRGEAMDRSKLPEPWLRGTLKEIPPAQRAVLHALEMAEEDVNRWCGNLTYEQIHASPFGLPPVAFHLRHIARSLDRMLTYAEGRSLTDEQLAALKAESDPAKVGVDLFSELASAIGESARRIRAFDVNTLDEVRRIGRKQLPTTVVGLLVHIADHTQRHVGQAITTAKLVLAQGADL
jgi:hypothetical protein